MTYPHSAAPGTGKTVALTFDDGPDPSTAQILGILNHYKVPATFFNIGQQEAKYASLVKAEAQQSYALGNHTWDHAGVLSQKDTDAIVNLAETEEIKLNHPVILTHNPLKGTPGTVAALPPIIEFFKAHGYTFVAL